MAQEDTQIFYHSEIDTALENCLDAGYTPLFMPQLVDHRIKADKGDPLWQQWFSTPSIRATGKTSDGKDLVLYVHTDNPLCNPTYMREARQDETKRINWAAKIEQAEFDRLAQLGLDKATDPSGNQLVYVVSHADLMKSKSNVIAVKDALQHPQTIPFLGGEERASKYLEKHQEIYGKKIGVWHQNDLHKGSPLARLLFVGDLDDGGLYGVNLLNDGRFLGVRAEGTRSVPQKMIKTPQPLEQILLVSKSFVPARLHAEFEQELRKVYSK